MKRRFNEVKKIKMASLKLYYIRIVSHDLPKTKYHLNMSSYEFAQCMYGITNIHISTLESLRTQHMFDI